MKLVTEILGDPQIETGKEEISLLGIGQASEVTLDYCRALMMEYAALDSAQLFTLLKKHGHIPDKQRLQIGKTLCREQYARRIIFEGRTYFVRHPKIQIKGRIKQQIRCFWVLLDYLDRVDRHFASGTPSSLISMEIEGRDYSILCAERGKEKMCSYQMAQGGATRYFVVVEEIGQIPLIKGESIHAFALLDERNTVKYFSV